MINWLSYIDKNNCFLFDRPFKIKKSGMFHFGIISFFVLEIFTFLYHTQIGPLIQ